MGYEREIANRALPYEIGYKQDYATSGRIYVYSHNSQSVEYVYTFGNMFPTSIQGESLAWENNTDILTLPVTFEFDTYYATGVGRGSKYSYRPGSDGTYVSPSRGFGGGATDFIQSINNLGAGLSGLGIDNNLQQVVNDITKVSGDFFAASNRISSVLDGTFF